MSAAPSPRRFKPLGIGSKLTLGFGALAAVALLVVALAYVAGATPPKTST